MAAVKAAPVPALTAAMIAKVAFDILAVARVGETFGRGFSFVVAPKVA